MNEPPLKNSHDIKLILTLSTTSKFLCGAFHTI